MRLVEDLSLFTEEVLQLKLKVSDTNYVEDPSSLDFTWRATDFSEKSMTIQLDFSRPAYISAGTERDFMRV